MRDCPFEMCDGSGFVVDVERRTTAECRCRPQRSASSTPTAASGHGAVSGGSGNTASAYTASVSGGAGNTASGDASSVGGGERNTASAPFASVSGGGFPPLL